jgi:hypothetical protein
VRSRAWIGTPSGSASGDSINTWIVNFIERLLVRAGGQFAQCTINLSSIKPICYMTSCPSVHSEHILDWFHIGMRAEQLSQTASGFRGVYECLMTTEKILKELERVESFLWHGNVFRADETLSSDGTGRPHAFRRSSS